MNTLSTNMFCKSSNKRRLVTEASDLGWPSLYAPEHFTLTSEWTGRSIAMEKINTQKDEEGDIIMWMYKPANKAANINLTVEVFND